MNPRFQGYFLDIWFPATSKALEFGRRKLEVKIVEYGEPGQPIREETPEDKAAAQQASAENNSVWQTIKNQLASIGYLIGARGKNVDRFDIDCLTEDKK